MNSKQRFDVFTGALQRAGLRLTPQRQAVCEYLAGSSGHPSPYQVFADITEAHPEISRATVYNTLNTLQQLGAIVELSFGADHTHYDTNPEPHINLICLRCHEIEDYAGSLPLDELSERILGETGFQTAAAKVDLIGFCARCREQRLAEIRAQAKGAQFQGAQFQGEAPHHVMKDQFVSVSNKDVNL
jgi:Fur family peroxide stress response transcriptional regulator